jgi:aspartokinase-like uncharacterized kinase
MVIKIGGGLADVPGALGVTCDAVGELGRARRIVVIPGGGAFADGVRSFERKHNLSPDAAHWMAILAMEQYAHVLAERIPGARLVEEPDAVVHSLEEAGVAVLAPYRWMRAADVLPHSWEATSDSVAAFVAGALDADRLILVKPGEPLSGDAVDSCFAAVIPAGLPVTITGWERLRERLEPLGSA